MVKIYTQPACMPCRFTKRKLEEKGIPFEEIDLTEDVEAMAYVKSLGYASAPVVVTEDNHWSGLRLDLIEAI